MKKVQGKEAEELILKAVETICDMNFTLTDIVHHFIQKRGFAYKAEVEET